MRIKTDRISEIAALLRRETAMYADLHKIARQIQQSIVKNNIDQLGALVESEDTLFTRAENLRQERFSLLQNLKQELNLTDEEYSLARMLEFMDEEDARQIQDLRDKLIDSINKLDVVNRNNHVLVNYSLDLNGKFMNLLLNLGENNTVYHQSGKVKTANTKRRLLDKKA
ncbi:MAG: flagellar protein FlgN [Candidatus Auribacterota bacterium]